MATVNEKAVKWALDKVGYKYSQPKRLEEDYFDCSSLVARAYQASGYEFTCQGAPIPTSYKEVYDDCFELLWPEKYEDIGKKYGGKSVIALGTKQGDLQFLNTTSTSRHNKITHVTMVSDKNTIVHARGTKYGVVTNDIDLYSGKVCAITRYNPNCELRLGHKGDRVRELQRELNKKGANISVDGVYGETTAEAVKKYGGIDNNTPVNNEAETKYGVCSGGSVNVRSGPGTSNKVLGVIRKDDKILFIDKGEGWSQVAAEINGSLIVGYMSNRYIKAVE